MGFLLTLWAILAPIAVYAAIIYLIVRYVKKKKKSKEQTNAQTITKGKDNRVNTSIDLQIIEMVDIAVNKIAYRYPGEIYICIADRYSKIAFEEIDGTAKDIFRALINKTKVSLLLDYNFALSYYGITERQATMLRDAGYIENDNWVIVTNRNVNQATISKARSIIQSHSDQIRVVDYGSNESRISIRCEQAG